MVSSPFHGIFSSLGQEDATGFPSYADSDLPAPSLPRSADAVRTSQSGAAQAGQIAVDIYEQDNYYIIRAPIAGVRLTDLDIEVDGKAITIRGVRRSNEVVDADQYYLEECFWGEFSRTITLPCTVDPKKIKATFSKDCVLKVLVPKEEKVKIVRINEGG